MVLCFVEFTDAKCALTALEALQGQVQFLMLFRLYHLGCM